MATTLPIPAPIDVPVSTGLARGNHQGRVRTCDTTGLPVCLVAERFIRLNAVMAVVSLLVGGVAALLIALTRWPAVHLLDATWYYRLVTTHGLNMLIFWIIFMEIAILYFAGPILLNSRLASAKLAWISLGMMVAGMLVTNASILVHGRADVMMTSYVPLQAHPSFYLGLLLFAVGALLGVANFFATLHVARRDHTYEGSVPLVTFGATAAAIIAVVAILHGAIALVPTFTWSLGLHGAPDAGWYRLVWWGLGHQSLGMSFAGSYGVPRRHWDVEFVGAQFAAGFDPGAHVRRRPTRPPAGSGPGRSSVTRGSSSVRARRSARRRDPGPRRRHARVGCLPHRGRPRAGDRPQHPVAVDAGGARIGRRRPAGREARQEHPRLAHLSGALAGEPSRSPGGSLPRLLGARPS